MTAPKVAVVSANGVRTSFGSRLQEAAKYAAATNGLVVKRCNGTWGVPNAKRSYRWIPVDGRE